MTTNITLEQALAKASKMLQQKMMYSIDLLKKAERLALAYGGGNGLYDWWISGKSYKEWYADKFLQTKLEFPEEE